VQNERALLAHLRARGFDEAQACGEAELGVLSSAKSVSREVLGFLRSGRLAHYIREQRKRRPDRPITFRYILNRACSLDWGVLDLFYQLTVFDTFKEAFDLAENGGDEGPICNLSLISDYLARFQEQTSPVISAQFLSDSKFARKLFSSFLYSIFRLDEGEYEDKEDPFPKGRIPFLTIHQAKGLEFPVVVLGNLRKDGSERVLDQIARHLGAKRREPSDLAPTYDVARMFYVALSRAQQALIVCPFRGAGQRYREEFKEPIRRYASPLTDLKVDTIEPSDKFEDAIPHPYSFTGDYIQYSICPRRYMLYRRFGFVPSRSQTTIFGNLVHRTIEDLHQLLIQAREPTAEGVTP
jgi:ATP-dependent DNA helicase UvrD/PcrA